MPFLTSPYYKQGKEKSILFSFVKIFKLSVLHLLMVQVLSVSLNGPNIEHMQCLQMPELLFKNLRIVSEGTQGLLWILVCRHGCY